MRYVKNTAEQLIVARQHEMLSPATVYLTATFDCLAGTVELQLLIVYISFEVLLVKVSYIKNNFFLPLHTPVLWLQLKDGCMCGLIHNSIFRA